MPVTLNELLQPQVIVDTISQVTVGRGNLSQWLGFSLDSKSIKKVPTRYADYRIYNSTREPANFRAPGTGPNLVPPNPVGDRRVSMARVHEKIVLESEQLGNLSKLDGPNAQIDSGGQDYIARQEAFLAEKFNASVEIATAGFVRGAFYLQQVGDAWTPYLTNPGSGTVLTIDFQLPSGNKTQLNMLGAGSIIDSTWANPGTLIIDQILAIRSAMVQLHGMPLQCLVMNSTTFKYLLNNTQVRAVGGVVNSPHEGYEYKDSMQAGYPFAGMGVAKLRALPWIDILIIDDVLSVGGSDPIYSTGSGTLTKVVPDDYVMFSPKPTTAWCQMWHGGEFVAEDYGWKKMELKMGLSAWKWLSIEPTAVNIVSLLNFLPVPYRVSGHAWGQVAGF